MKISRLEYVKMQVSLTAAFCSIPGSCKSNHEWVKREINDILAVNGITVADEPALEPISKYEFYRICDENHEVGDGIEGIVAELAKRGLVIS